MRATEFLTEENIPYQSERLAIEKAKQFMNTHCSEALGMLQRPLWRGMVNHKSNATLIRADTGSRLSRNTSNYYTLLLDTSPHMAGWPKRSKSLICTTDINYADNYAYSLDNIFAIFPVNGAKIAVCPGKDIWETEIRIPEINNAFDGEQSLSEFNHWLERLGVVDSIQGLQNAYKLPDVRRLCGKFDVTTDQFIPILQKALSPDQAGFRLMSIPQFVSFNRGESHECWVSGQVLAIKHSMWEKMIKINAKQKAIK